MPVWSQIVVVLLTPFALAGFAWWLLERRNAPVWDTPIDLGEAWLRLLGSGVTPRRLLKAAIIAAPFLFLNDLVGFFPFWFILALLGTFALLRALRQRRALDARTHEVLASLRSVSQNLAQTRLHLQLLENLVRTGQSELDQQEALRTQLEHDIAARVREREVYAQLTDAQRDLLLNQVRVAQRKGLFAVILVVLGSIIVNLAASLIWTLMGNPGREQIIETAQRAWTSVIQ